ncbi:MAG: 16S rRNA (guanine(527)-N(7))-methyltransferase RsmG [Pyrinomonadaceae bacterium]
MREKFIETIEKYQSDFGLNLSDEKISALFDYYKIVAAHNDLLHLVAPCEPEIFAARHVLESLTLLEFLPENAKFADVGAGAGLPSIPCLIAREDLRGILIESSQKKANFLRQTIAELKLSARAEIINRQFEEIRKPAVELVTSRALDKFTKKLPALIKWAGKTRSAFFGGNNLRESLQKLRLDFDAKLTPQSEQRFLFIV